VVVAPTFIGLKVVEVSFVFLQFEQLKVKLVVSVVYVDLVFCVASVIAVVPVGKVDPVAVL
jgi:hypothetical protein